MSMKNSMEHYSPGRSRKVEPPIIDPRLIAYLDAVFPDQCPKMSDSDREVWAKVGTRRVVNHLKFIYEQQQREE